MIKKNLLSLILCGITAASLFTGCGKDPDVSLGSETASESSASSSGDNNTESNPDADFSANVDIMNFTAPEIGDQIIEMTIKDYGTVKFRLFPEYAEKGVENFVGLANTGFYDGLTFHRIINDFMIQGGDPEGNGTGGSSMWGSMFDGGVNNHLIHVGGAVAYANSGSTSTNRSQFFIVTGRECDDEYMEYLQETSDCQISDKAKELYKQYKGYPFLDGKYTVFGQVIDGLDVVYEIQYVAKDGENKPFNDVVIDTVRVTEYNGEPIRWSIDDYKDFVSPAERGIINYTEPEIGDKIVKMNVKDFGTVTFRLFPDVLPTACENFFALAESGYYDGLTFHRIIQDFMIQGGDPKGDGTGGESTWGGYFDGGVASNLAHVAGALAYANAGSTKTDGSQFYIVTGEKCDDEYLGRLESYGYTFSEKTKEDYKKAGKGYPSLDGNYTVFGQVIDGLDVVFEIQNVKTEEGSGVPFDKVIIESMTVEEYDGSPVKFYLSDYETADNTQDETDSNTDEETDKETETEEQDSEEETTATTTETVE